MVLEVLDILRTDGFQLAGVFLIVFLLNLLPAFAPPTWIALSAVRLGAPDINPIALALTGAVAATFGRMLLAKIARIVLRGHLLGEEAKKNVDQIRTKIEAHRTASVTGLLLYSLSPLPSNHLFVAYGLTSLNISYVAAPFFAGRLASYSFWIFTAGVAGRKFDLDADDAAFSVGFYFVVTQLLIVPLIYLFVKIDWKSLFEERRLLLRRTPKADPSQ